MDGGFADNSYSRRHRIRFDGGAVVTGSSSPDVVPEPMSDHPASTPKRPWSPPPPCHMLWFLSLAQAAGLDVASYRDAAEGDGPGRAGRIGFTRIVLHPRIAFNGAGPTPRSTGSTIRHERCFIANSLTARSSSNERSYERAGSCHCGGDPGSAVAARWVGSPAIRRAARRPLLAYYPESDVTSPATLSPISGATA
jgi:hypothetical protein